MPFSKVYRAFPELDRFEDRACRAWVYRAWRSGWWLIATAEVVGVLIGILVLVGEVAAAIAMWMRISGAADSAWGPVLIVCFMVLALAGLLVPAIGVLTARDWALRRLIRQQLADARCVRCRYLLLGLRVAEGAVTCSECGERMVLAELGLTAADIMARPTA